MCGGSRAGVGSTRGWQGCSSGCWRCLWVTGLLGAAAVWQAEGLSPPPGGDGPPSLSFLPSGRGGEGSHRSPGGAGGGGCGQAVGPGVVGPSGGQSGVESTVRRRRRRMVGTAVTAGTWPF